MRPTGAPNQVMSFGKYMLVERLGRGGMAEVWKAKILGPAGFERTLVIKRILPHLVEDPRFVQMFVAEARLSARLNHANVVQVFELGDVDGEYFLAMEYVRGRDLVSAVRALLQKGLPPPGMGAFVVREVCRALGYAHALADENGQPLRLIHRDVSPSNVMLSFDGAVKLLDFGIAKALAEANENKTQTGTLKGKFGYMSPEQVEGKDIDHRADLFAAGIVLHEVLTGRRLFKGQNDLQTIAMVREGKVDPPSVLNPDVPPELDRICLKALSKSRDERYATCDEMAIELDDVVHSLKWGPERLGSLMKEIFPEEPPQTGQVALVPSETMAGSNLTIGALRRHERKRNIAFGAAGLAMVTGLALLIAAKVTPPTPVDPPLEKKPQFEEKKTVAASAETEVSIALRATPEESEVWIGGHIKCTTPCEFKTPRSDQPMNIVFKAAGYQDKSEQVTPRGDNTLATTLSPIVKEVDEAVIVPPKQPVKTKAAVNRVKATQPSGEKPKIKTNGDDSKTLKDGKVIDPFANDDK